MEFQSRIRAGMFYVTALACGGLHRPYVPFVTIEPMRVER
jgi:hypothetical protein